MVYYDIGVNGFVGGVFGKGLSRNVRAAYEWLIDNSNPGDDIFVFGFSRQVLCGTLDQAAAGIRE